MAFLKHNGRTICYRLLGDAERSLSAYLTELDDTLSVAERDRTAVEISEQQRDILRSVQASRSAAQVLRDAVTAYVDFTERKGMTISQAASGM